MQTVQSWIDNPHAGDVWFNGADLLEHLERYDVEHAAFNHKSDFDRFRQRRFVAQVTAYQPEAIADFEAILEQVAERPRRRSRSRISEDGDDLDVDAYIDALDSGRRDVWIEDVVLVGSLQAGAAMRAERHAVPCGGRLCEQVQTRRAGRKGRRFPYRRQRLCRADFPTLWGAFTDNATCNDMLNLVAETVVGTGLGGNGNCVRFKADIANPTYILPDLNTFMEMPR